jgi:uncharacterized membrane protein (DUF106 family)
MTTASFGLRQGLIGGLIMIILSLLLNMSGMMEKNMIAAGLLGMLLFVVFIGIVIYGIGAFSKKHAEGTFTFGDGFKLGITIALIMGIISVIFGYIYQTFIDPDQMERMASSMLEFLENRGVPEDQIQATIDKMREGSENPIAQLPRGLMMYLIIGAIASAIGGAIFKKKETFA